MLAPVSSSALVVETPTLPDKPERTQSVISRSRVSFCAHTDTPYAVIISDCKPDYAHQQSVGVLVDVDTVQNIC